MSEKVCGVASPVIGSAQRRLAIISATWGALGLLMGLIFRELTRSSSTDPGMLGLMHGHTLVLGMVFILIVTLLEGQYALSRFRSFTVFLYSWNLGLAITVGMMFANGVRSLSGAEHSAAIAGIAGLGHIALTIGLIAFFRALLLALPRAAK